MMINICEGMIIVKIVDMKCNRIVNPLGFNLDQLRLSWIVESGTAKTQLASAVKIALDEGFQQIVDDSGRRTDIDSIGYSPDLQLEPCTRYFWQVQVWTDIGEVISPVAWFETGKMDQPWHGQWISPDSDDTSIIPLLRGKFNVAKQVEEARLYVCGLGLYEAEINGGKVGDEYLTPNCNSYDNWIQYQTYDVTHQLVVGTNVIGAILADGWYKGRFTYKKDKREIYGDRLGFLCELAIKYSDGTSEIVGSDQTWKYQHSHIISSSIYDGEIQDANKYISGWSTAACSDENWLEVRLLDIGYDRLEARLSLPVKIKEEIKPVKLIHTPKDEVVLDMGQNMVGWLRFSLNAPQGEKIYLQFGEALQDGCFSQENLRAAKAEFTYISDGKPALVEPHFTFYGFRYVKVQGWSGEINLADFTGCVVYSDLEITGEIETSNPLVNRLFQNALWGQKGNFLDVPTDCPQRNERMGWTGDAQMFSGTACFNMDCDAFFTKYLYDLALEQKSLGGMVPHFVPTFAMAEGGSAAWADAATIIPWNVYLHYGNKAILAKQFESMKAHVDYIKSKDDGSRLWNSGFHYGDWLALDGQGEFSRPGGTPTDLIATAFYAYSAGIVAKAAAVLGKTDIAQEYEALSNEVKEAFCDEFLTPRNRIVGNTQTAYILALFMDLIPETSRARVIELLVENLAANNNYLKTGFVGTPYLCRVLSENGHNDLAYQLLLNEEFPSWLYAVKLGATTIWERWNSLLPDGKFGELGMNSLNHYVYGSIAEWMYRNMCGINPVEEAPGFRKVRLTPQPDQSLEFAKAIVKTAAGVYESGWRYQDDRIIFEFVIPFNREAEFVIPHANPSELQINAEGLAQSGIAHKQQNGLMTLNLTAGSYIISYKI